MENVLAVPSAVLDARLPEGTFISRNIPELLALIREHQCFIPRSQAEQDLRYRQIIPYAVLRNKGRYFMTRRLPKQGETRLHGKFSIGMGGHINRREAQAEDPVRAGLRRELREEVGLREVPLQPCAGLLNDPSEEVGKYHLGLVFPLSVPEEIRVMETGKMTGGWTAAEDVEAQFGKMETWSQIVWRVRSVWESR